MRLTHDISLYTVGNMLSSATLFSGQRWHRSQPPSVADPRQTWRARALGIAASRHVRPQQHPRHYLDASGAI